MFLGKGGSWRSAGVYHRAHRRTGWIASHENGEARATKCGVAVTNEEMKTETQRKKQRGGRDRSAPCELADQSVVAASIRRSTKEGRKQRNRRRDKEKRREMVCVRESGVCERSPRQV